MTYPTRRDLEVPLLRVLLELGGEARPSEIYEPLAALFPLMTAEEREVPRANGEPQWHNDVRFARQELVTDPEQYMAPLLSAMETGESIPLHGEDDFLDGVPAKLSYPANLVLIGTVNMDETTHGLSDKVLDRAFVLEFWKVDLELYRGWEATGLRPADGDRVRRLLTGLMESLEPSRLHFGWRTIDDVLSYLRHVDEEALTLDAALDSVIYAKVLPKLRGEDSPRLRTALKACETVLEQHGLSQSVAKVKDLHNDLTTTGSCRFWR